MTEAMKGHLAMLCFSMLIAGSFALGSMAANHIAPTVHAARSIEIKEAGYSPFFAR